jgi:hypothetical protein
MVVSSACTQATATWTGSRADALRRALGMTNESFAHHLGVSVRIVAYWRKRPDMLPQQQMQEILGTALERAAGPAKEKFALLANEGNELPGVKPATGAVLPQLAYNSSLDSGASTPADAGFDVALLDVLSSADMDNRIEVSQASWLPGAAPGVITAYLFSSPTWRDQGQSLIVAPSGAAARIREVARHLMDIDFKFGGGYVRRMLLFYFQSEIVPLLREPQPEAVRREIFGAAAEVAQLLGFLSAEPVFA